jgi:hypothetical protein
MPTQHEAKSEAQDELLQQIMAQFPTIKMGTKDEIIKKLIAECNRLEQKGENVGAVQRPIMGAIEPIFKKFAESTSFNATSIAMLFALLPFYLKYVTKKQILNFKDAFNAKCDQDKGFLRLVLMEPMVIKQFLEFKPSDLQIQDLEGAPEIRLHYGVLRRQYLVRHVPHRMAMSGTGVKEEKLTKENTENLANLLKKDGDRGEKLIVTLNNQYALNDFKRFIADSPEYLANFKEIEVVYAEHSLHESYENILSILSSANIEKITLTEKQVDPKPGQNIITKAHEMKKHEREARQKREKMVAALPSVVARTGVTASIVLQLPKETQADIVLPALPVGVEEALAVNRRQFNKSQLSRLYSAEEKQIIQVDSIISTLPEKFGSAIDFSMFNDASVKERLVALLNKYPKRIIEDLLHQLIDDSIFGKSMHTGILYPALDTVFKSFARKNAVIFDVQRKAMQIVSSEKWNEAVRLAESRLMISKDLAFDFHEIHSQKTLIEGLVATPDIEKLRDSSSREFADVVNVLLALMSCNSEINLLQTVMNPILSMEVMKVIDIAALTSRLHERMMEIEAPLKPLLDKIEKLNSARLLIANRSSLNEDSLKAGNSSEKIEELRKRIADLTQSISSILSDLAVSENDIEPEFQNTNAIAHGLGLRIFRNLNIMMPALFGMLNQFQLDRIKAEKSAKHPYILEQTENAEAGFQTQQQHQVQAKEKETKRVVVTKPTPTLYEEKQGELDKWLGKKDQRITPYMTVAAQEYLQQNAKYFVMGLQRENLPQGLSVDIRPTTGEEFLDYNPALRSQPNKSPLTQMIKLGEDKKQAESTTKFAGKISQFAGISDQYKEMTLDQYIEATKGDPKAALQPLIDASPAESAKLIQMLCDELKIVDAASIATAVSVIYTHSSEALRILANKIKRMPEPYRATFIHNLKEEKRWEAYLTPEMARFMDGVAMLSTAESIWWNALSKQHDSALAMALPELFNGFKYFVQQYKLIKECEDLPETCPLQNVSNMLVGLDRYLGLMYLDPKANSVDLSIDAYNIQYQQVKKSPLAPNRTAIAEEKLHVERKEYAPIEEKKRTHSHSAEKNESVVTEEDRNKIRAMHFDEAIIFGANEDKIAEIFAEVKSKKANKLAANTGKIAKILGITKDNLANILIENKAIEDKAIEDKAIVVSKFFKNKGKIANILGVTKDDVTKIVDAEKYNILLNGMLESQAKRIADLSLNLSVPKDIAPTESKQERSEEKAMIGEEDDEILELHLTNQPDTTTLSHRLKLISSYAKVFSWGSESVKTVKGFDNLLFAGQDPEDLKKIVVTKVEPNLTDVDEITFPISAYELSQRLSADKLASLSQSTITLDRPQKAIKDMSDGELRNAVGLLKNEIEKLSNTNVSAEQDKLIEAKLYFLALLRESLFRTEQSAEPRFPNLTQILSVINETIINGGNSFAQIETGQGKSLTTALMAAMLWAEGRTVEVCTSDAHLANEGASEFSEFFKFIGADCAGVAITDSDESENVGNYKHGGINYSDITSMAMFRSKMLVNRGNDFFEGETSCILDEADYIMDYTTTIRYVPKADDAHDVSQYPSVYFAINDFIDSSEFQDIPAYIVDKREYLIKIAKEYIDKHADPSEAKIADHLINNNDQIDLWLQAAWKSKTLAETGEKEQKFVLSDKIVAGKTYSVVHHIIDQKENEHAQLMNGGQQFLHARLQKAKQASIRTGAIQDFVIEAEQAALTSLTSKQFIDFYNKSGGIVKGITGTLGDRYKKERARELFGADLTSVPLHQDKQRQDEVAILADEGALNAEILAQVKTMRAAGRPVLIICENPVEAKKMAEVLKSIDDPAALLYTATHKSPGLAHDSDAIKAANENGAIMIADSSLGRGKDFKPKHQDGLHVIVNYLGTDQEVKQAVGRSGRQGKKGSSYHVVTQAQVGTFYNAAVIGEPRSAEGQRTIQQQMESARDAIALAERQKKPFTDSYDNIQAYFQDIYIADKNRIDRAQYSVFKATLQSKWDEAMRLYQSRYSLAEVEQCVGFVVTAIAPAWINLLAPTGIESNVEQIKAEISKMSAVRSAAHKTVGLETRQETFDFLPEELRTKAAVETEIALSPVLDAKAELVSGVSETTPEVSMGTRPEATLVEPVADEKHSARPRDGVEPVVSTPAVEESDEQKAQQKAAKQRTQFKNIVSEINNTEESYLNGLKRLVPHLENLMRLSIHSTKLTALEREKLASYIEVYKQIVTLQEIFLRQSGESEATYFTRFCNEMEGHKQDLARLYTNVLNQYENFSSLTGKLIADKSIPSPIYPSGKLQFESWGMVKKFDDQGQEVGQDTVSTLLITPVQRIPRYQLLMAEAGKQLELDRPLKQVATTALDVAKEVGKAINEAKRVAEARADHHAGIITRLDSYINKKMSELSGLKGKEAQPEYKHIQEKLDHAKKVKAILDETQLNSAKIASLLVNFSRNKNKTTYLLAHTLMIINALPADMDPKSIEDLMTRYCREKGLNRDDFIVKITKTLEAIYDQVGPSKEINDSLMTQLTAGSIFNLNSWKEQLLIRLTKPQQTERKVEVTIDQPSAIPSLTPANLEQKKPQWHIPKLAESEVKLKDNLNPLLVSLNYIDKLSEKIKLQVKKLDESKLTKEQILEKLDEIVAGFQPQINNIADSLNKLSVEAINILIKKCNVAPGEIDEFKEGFDADGMFPFLSFILGDSLSSTNLESLQKAIELISGQCEGERSFAFTNLWAALSDRISRNEGNVSSEYKAEDEITKSFANIYLNEIAEVEVRVRENLSALIISSVSDDKRGGIINMIEPDLSRMKEITGGVIDLRQDHEVSQFIEQAKIYLDVPTTTSDTARAATLTAEAQAADGLKALYERYHSADDFKYDAQGVKTITIGPEQLTNLAAYFPGGLKKGVTLFFYEAGKPQDNPPIFYLLQQKVMSLYAAAGIAYPGDLLEKEFRAIVQQIILKTTLLASNERAAEINKLTSEAMETRVKLTLETLYDQYPKRKPEYAEFVEEILDKSQRIRSSTASIASFNESTMRFSFDEGANFTALTRGRRNGAANVSWTCDGSYNQENQFNVTSSLVKHASLLTMETIDSSKFDFRIFMKTYENVLAVIQKQADILHRGGADVPIVVNFNYNLLMTSVPGVEDQDKAYLYIRRAIQALDGAKFNITMVDQKPVPVTVNASIMNIGVNKLASFTSIPLSSGAEAREDDNRKSYLRLSAAADGVLHQLNYPAVHDWLMEKQAFDDSIKDAMGKQARIKEEIHNAATGMHVLYQKYKDDEVLLRFRIEAELAKLVIQPKNKEKLIKESLAADPGLSKLQADIEQCRDWIQKKTQELNRFEKMQAAKQSSIWKKHEKAVLNCLGGIVSKGDIQPSLLRTIFILKVYLDQMYYSGSYKSSSEKAAIFHTYQLALERLVGMNPSIGCNSENDSSYLIRVMTSVIAAQPIPVQLIADNTPESRAAFAKFKDEFSKQSMTDSALHSCIANTSGGTPMLEAGTSAGSYALLENTNISKMKKLSDFASYQMLKNLGNWLKPPVKAKAKLEAKIDHKPTAKPKKLGVIQRIASLLKPKKAESDMPPLELSEFANPVTRSVANAPDEKALSSPATNGLGADDSVSPAVSRLDAKHSVSNAVSSLEVNASLSPAVNLADNNSSATGSSAIVRNPPHSTALSADNALVSPAPAKNGGLFSSSSSIASRLVDSNVPKGILAARQQKIASHDLYRALMPAQGETLSQEYLTKIQNEQSDYVGHPVKNQSIINVIPSASGSKPLLGFIEQVTEQNIFKIVPVLPEPKNEAVQPTQEELEKLAFEMIQAFVDRRPGTPIRILPGNNADLVACYILICKVNKLTYKNESEHHQHDPLADELSSRLETIKKNYSLPIEKPSKNVFYPDETSHLIRRIEGVLAQKIVDTGKNKNDFVTHLTAGIDQLDQLKAQIKAQVIDPASAGQREPAITQIDSTIAKAQARIREIQSSNTNLNAPAPVNNDTRPWTFSRRR